MGKNRQRIGCLLLALFASACDSETPLGSCIGVNGVPRSDRRYEYSTKNVILGIVFIETVIVPVVVVLNKMKCPVAVVTPSTTP